MKTIEEVLNCYYKKEDGYYHTNIGEHLDFQNQDDLDTLHEALTKLLDDHEILFVYDDTISNKSAGYILFRDSNWVLCEYLKADKSNFVFNASRVVYNYPVEKLIERDELVEFIERLESYSNFEKIPILIKNFKFKNQDELEKLKYTSNEDLAKIKLLSFFWRRVYIQAVFLVSFILIFLQEIKLSLLSLSIGTIIYSLYMIIGIKLRFKHVYYIITKSMSKKPDMNDIYWEKLKKGSLYFFPKFLLIVSIVILIIGVII